MHNGKLDPVTYVIIATWLAWIAETIWIDRFAS